MKKYILFVLSLVLVFFVFQKVDLEVFYAEMRVFSTINLLTVLMLFVVNALVVMLRYWRVLTHFGRAIPFTDVVRASVSANIASLLMIPLVGQVAGRQAILNKAGVTATENAAIAAYERFVAGSLSGVLAILGAGYIFSPILSEYLKDIPLIQISIILIGSYSLYACFVLSRSERLMLNTIFSIKSFLNIIEVYFITLLGSTVVLYSFFILFSVILPDVEILKILAAAAIVSFLAGLPVSFGGWGLREVSSIYVITALGGSSASALAASVMQGLISTAAVLLIFPLVFLKSKIAVLPPKIKESLKNNKISIEKLALWLLTFLVFSLVFFQVHVKVGEGYLNINLADPFAILVFSVIMLNFAFKRELPSWSIPKLNVYIFLISFAFIFSYIVGFYNFGKIDWATGKVVGWLVLLGYLFSGNLVVRNFGLLGYFRLAKLMLIIITLILIFNIILWFLFVNEIIVFAGSHRILEAYSGNRNALSFQVLVVLCVSLAFNPWEYDEKFNSYKAVFFKFSLCIMVAAIFIAGSRSAIGTMVMLFLFSWLLGVVKFKIIFNLFFIGLFLFVSAQYGLYFINNLVGFFTGSSVSSVIISLPISPESSDSGRWDLIVYAFNMWLDNPVFGAGLGAFYNGSTELMGFDVVIHNTPLWLLAEFGLFGFIVFLVPFIAIIKYALYDCRYVRVSNAILLLLLLFVMMGVFHEVIYQRMFWLVLGGLIVLPKYSKSSNKAFYE